MKILVVDDSAVQRKMIISIIRKAEYENEILEAGDGREAIQKLGANFKDVGIVLCDWNMPNLSGVEFLAAVAQVPQVASVPCIMITSEGTEAKIKEAYEKFPAMAGYLTKPFTAGQLKEKLDAVLKK